MAYSERRRELPPLQEGQTLTWPDVNPATIVYVFDTKPGLSPDDPMYKRGYIGVRASGNVDVFWHRWVKGPEGTFRSALSHHGGKDGFPDIDVAIRQCRRIITGYVGIEDTIEIGDNLERSEPKPPVSLRDFGEFIGTNAETIFIPGAEAWAMDVKTQIDRAVREIISKPGSLRLGDSIRILQALSSKLNRSTNPLLNEIGGAVQRVFLTDNRFEQLDELRRGEQMIIDRMAQISSMVVSVMQRHNRLEAHRSNAEANVRRLYFDVLRKQGQWTKAGEDEFPGLAGNLVADARLYLDSLITNPFRQRSKRFDPLRDLDTTLKIAGPDAAAQVIKTSAIELHNWKEEIYEAQRGRFTDRYPVIG